MTVPGRGIPRTGPTGAQMRRSARANGTVAAAASNSAAPGLGAPGNWTSDSEQTPASAANPYQHHPGPIALSLTPPASGGRLSAR